MGDSALRSDTFASPPARDRGRLRPRRPVIGRSDGFTLVELLVVIAIISILVMLLLPGLQSVRESGRRLQCKSNMKNVALAVRNYATDNGVLPPAGIVDPERVVDHHMIDDFESRLGGQFSWIVMVLPLLGEQGLFDRFDFEVSVFDQPSDPQSVAISVLRCPSNGAGSRHFEAVNPDGGGTLRRFAKGNYAAYVSPFHVELCEYFPGALSGYAQPLALIRDGEAKTIMLSEVLARDHRQDQRGAWALPWTGSSLLAFDLHYPHPLYSQEIPLGSGRRFWKRPRPPYKTWDLSVGQNQPPNNQGPNFDMLYECPDPEQAQFDRMPCSQWARGTSFEYLSAAPRSNHRGGVNVAFVDGHVTFLTDSVDLEAMAYLISIDDGQIRPVDEYVR
jgi:prepilin-type N-terminal cleavage/methylation domain-containing protein/prepilin-type processing-associated H-X9-DG protein